MSFIIEFLPKFGKKKEFSVVVRQPNGFPCGLFDTLDEAKDFMDNELSKALQAESKTA